MFREQEAAMLDAMWALMPILPRFDLNELIADFGAPERNLSFKGQA